MTDFPVEFPYTLERQQNIIYSDVYWQMSSYCTIRVVIIYNSIYKRYNAYCFGSGNVCYAIDDPEVILEMASPLSLDNAQKIIYWMNFDESNYGFT